MEGAEAETQKMGPWGPVTESWYKGQKWNGKQMLGGEREEETENELLRAQLLRHEADILALGG